MDSESVISSSRKKSFTGFSRLAIYIICGTDALAATIAYFVFFIESLP